MPIEFVQKDDSKVLPRLENPVNEVREETKPTLTDTFKASFRLDNSIVSAFSSEKNFKRFGQFDPDFDWDQSIRDLPEDKQLEADQYSLAENQSEFDAISSQIDRERQDRQILAQSGGFASVASSLIAGVLDPINFVPVIGQGSKVLKTGKSILDGAANVGFAGMVGASLSEASLHATQTQRTYGESAINIAGGTLLSGMLGSGAAALKLRNTPEFKAVADKVETEMQLDNDVSPLNEEVADFLATKDLSAAAAQVTTIKEETLKSALGLEKLVKFQDPVLRGIQSSSLAMRKATQELAEIPMKLNKNKEGLATTQAVETKIKLDQANLARGLRGVDDAFKEYKKNNKGKDRLSYHDFKESVGVALFSGDQSPNPAVTKAAKTLRAEVFEPMKKRAIELELLPEDVDVKTADSYFSRIYNIEKITAKRNEFIDIVSKWLRTQDRPENVRALEDSDDQWFSDVANQITDNILGRGTGTSHKDVKIPGMRGAGGRTVASPLKGRTFLIPDELIADFLETDAEVVSKIFLRNMSTETRMVEQFGDLEFTRALEDIQQEFDDLLAKATTDKQRVQLDKEARAAKRDLEAMRDRLLGTFGRPDDPDAFLTGTVPKTLTQINYLSKLGGMTISAIPDMGRIIARNGLLPMMRDGLVPLAKNFNTLKLAAQEIKDAGTALDLVLDSRVMAINDVMDNYGKGSKFERGLDHLSDNFSKFTGMAYWNAGLKQFSGVISQTNMIRAMEALGKGQATAKEIEDLASRGIDKVMADRIRKQFIQFGQTRDGVKLPNTGKWTDYKAVEVLRAAIVKEVDTTIVTPGLDKPLWMSKGMGKLIGQFRSFAFSSMQKTTLTTLQDLDMNHLNGMVFMTGLGAMVSMIKTKSRGDKVDTNPSALIAEGVDRSGLMAWFMDANNILEKTTRGQVGVSRLLGKQPMSRYASRNVFDSVFGPSVGILKDLTTVVGSVTNNDIRQSDIRKTRRMLPYQNLIGARRLFDEAEKSINQTFGVRK